MTRFCTACGTPQGDETARFCAKCGAAVAAPPTSHIAVTPKRETTSYKKVFFSTYAVIAAVLCLIAVLWIAVELRSKYETRAAEQRERDAKQLAMNLKGCSNLRTALNSSPGWGMKDNGPHDAFEEEFGHWMHKHWLEGVWRSPDGTFYDGMSNEDYAACRAKVEPALKEAGISVPDCSEGELVQIHYRSADAKTDEEYNAAIKSDHNTSLTCGY